MNAAQLRGLNVFINQGKCVSCHATAMFTKASTLHLIGENQEEGLVKRMVMGDNGVAIYDNGFYNIGVRPTFEDIGRGGDINDPLSFARQEKIRAGGGNVLDPFETDPCTFEENPCVPVDPNERDAVDGSFKVSTIRNVELTGPYLHNGGQSTLAQVVKFYNRGGDRRSLNPGDTTGFGPNDSNLDPDINSLGLSAHQQSDLVAFMLALTDERVVDESAPFDHPELFIPDGHQGDETACVMDGTVCADDTITVPAVGRDGRAAYGIPPITRTFLNLDPFGDLPKSTFVSFDHPEPAAGGALDGVFEGVDWGNGNWAWEGPYSVNSTNHIFFSSGQGTSRSFSFDGGPKVLRSIEVFSLNVSGTLTLSDGVQTVSQAITPGSLQIVQTNWEAPSFTVTVDFTAGWELGIDDIEYR